MTKRLTKPPPPDRDSARRFLVAWSQVVFKLTEAEALTERMQAHARAGAFPENGEHIAEAVGRALDDLEHVELNAFYEANLVYRVAQAIHTVHGSEDV